ncbi:MAG: hypothetical protein ACRDTR_06305 [Rubrobacter sp.]
MTFIEVDLAEHEKLRERNSALTDSLSRRRYRIVDAVAETLSRLSVPRWLRRRTRSADKTGSGN